MTEDKPPLATDHVHSSTGLLDPLTVGLLAVIGLLVVLTIPVLLKYVTPFGMPLANVFELLSIALLFLGVGIVVQYIEYLYLR